MDDIQKLVGQLDGKDDDLAEASVAALARYGLSALPALEALLGAPDSDKRWWAVRTLAEIQDEQSTSLLVRSLNDEEPGVRQCAALGLRRQPDPLSIPPLAKTLADSDHLVRELAADALVANGEHAVPALLEVLEKGEQPARLQAFRALTMTFDPRSIPALYAALEGDSSLMAYWAGEGLDRMGFGLTLFRPGS